MMKIFITMLLTVAVLAASMVNSTYATERYAHEQDHLAQAEHTHCEKMNAAMGQGKVSKSHDVEHAQKSDKPVVKSLCEIACHAPLMVFVHVNGDILDRSSVVAVPYALAAEVMPSWLSGVPVQPPKYI